MKKSIRHIVSVFLITMIFSCISFLSGVKALNEPIIEFGFVSAQSGKDVGIPVTIINNPGMASFRLRIIYDDSALTYQRTDSGTILTKGKIADITDASNHSVTLSWYSIDGDIAVDGEIAVLHFKVAENASGVYPLKVIYDKEDLVNSEFDKIAYTVHDGAVTIGYSIQGKVTSFGNESDAVALKLLSGTNEVDSVEVINGIYQFKSVQPGKYTICVSKKSHASRVYSITVLDCDLVQDIKICLLGDVTGDGKVKIGDYAKILAYVRGTSTLNAYEFACADVTGDGKVKIGDYAKVLAYVRGTAQLWQ